MDLQLLGCSEHDLTVVLKISVCDTYFVATLAQKLIDSVKGGLKK